MGGEVDDEGAVGCRDLEQVAGRVATQRASRLRPALARELGDAAAKRGASEDVFVDEARHFVAGAAQAAVRPVRGPGSPDVPRTPRSRSSPRPQNPSRRRQRSRSSEAGAGSPATMRQRSRSPPVDPALAQAIPGSRGSPRRSKSEKRACRTPSRLRGIQATRNGASSKSSSAARESSSLPSVTLRRRRRVGGMSTVSQSAVESASGWLRRIQPRSSRRSNWLEASSRYRTRPFPLSGPGHAGSSRSGCESAVATPRFYHPTPPRGCGAR